VLVALAAAIVPGCGDPQPAVNRVQPMALEKAMFAGEWYMQQTVIDTPYSVGFTFVGEQGGLERIVWEIQEDYLVARRSYQYIAGSEPQGIAGPGDTQGAAIAMYRIESHFDIRRDYNPTTGEELNVIEENSTDRPWYERRFFRVDWSTNLISETDLFALHRVIDGVTAEPVAYTVTDPSDPFAPQFVHDHTGTVTYMDIVNQMFVRPETVTFDDGFSIPVCYLYYHDHLDCTASQITIRNSFLRVDPNQEAQYQPLQYTGDRMQLFGYFNTIRAGYDEQYGVVEGARFHFVNRHNLWQASHMTTSSGALVPCTVDTATAANPMGCPGHGSVCDLDYARAHRTLDANGHLQGVCTIPYQQRTPTPVVYYTSSNLPADLWPDAQAFASDWNSAFVDTVSSLRENECLAGGGDAATCAMQRNRPDAMNMFVLCHSPVTAMDDHACGAVGTVANPGDLRYSLVGWVNEPFLASPLGYGPSSADPLTGEIIMGNAFVYGAGVETLESYARDLIKILNGDLPIADVENGVPVQDWLNHQVSHGQFESASASSAAHAVPIDPNHLETIANGMDFSWARGLRAESDRQAPSSIQDFIAQQQASQQRLYAGGAFGTPITAARASRVIGTDIEQAMVTPEMLMAAGLDPNTTLDAVTIAQASPLRGLSASHLTEIRQLEDQIQQHGCVLDTTFAEDGLLGLARQIQHAASGGDGTIQWYGQTYHLTNASGALDYELVRTMLRHPIFEAVTAHEVGHTLGLRHNFSGSYDALNYSPTYWDLRSHSDDGTMAPRLWDPESPSETAGRIREYQYSTVMDYGENFVSTDAQRIGHYDRAAIKMGYGDMVEVFSDTTNSNDVQNWALIQSLGWSVYLQPSSFTGGAVTAWEYTDWPSVVGSVEQLQHRADVPYTSLTDGAMTGLGNFSDAHGRPVVPYRFCSDEQADLGPDCLRYDAGADAYESLQSIADTYWNYYMFTNFRRQRIGFNPESVIGRVHDRWFEKLQNGNDIYVLDRAQYEDIWGAQLPATFWTGRHGYGAWTAATGTAYGLLTRVVAAPTPDTYVRHLTADGVEIYQGGGQAGATGAHTIDAFNGRYIDTTWNFADGYYWFDQIQRVGYFYDKVVALAVLTDPTTHFIGRDTDADIRRYQINFASTFGPAMTNFFRGSMGEDWHTVAPRFDPNGDLLYPSPDDQASGTMPGTPIDPDIGFSIELYASVLGMTYIPQTYNQDFLDRSRIWVNGGAEHVDIDPSHTIIHYTDAVSGLTYNAVSYPDSTGHEQGVGAQLLLHAQALDAHHETATLRRFVDNIDIVRRLTFLLGAGAQP
jgi:hypothetical protein